MAGAPARQVATPTPPPQPALQPPVEDQPRDGRLTAAEREALENWANESEPKPAPTSRKRQPKASAYLNGPAPKRSRKKQDTRDWLC